MRIALDWDDTWTRDAALWATFVRLALRQGHDVRIVTFRRPSGVPDIERELQNFQLNLEIIATNHISKRAVCRALGWEPHVWIDDMPELIVDPPEEYNVPLQLIRMVEE